MRYYFELATYERNGFEVIVDKTWEDMDVGHGFDDECYDVRKMREQINNGDLTGLCCECGCCLKDTKWARTT